MQEHQWMILTVCVIRYTRSGRESLKSWWESLKSQRLKQQLERNEGGCYETGLMWTENKLPLNNSKSGSLWCLKPVLTRFERNSKTFKAYDQVIRDQLLNNMTEKISENQSENLREFFLPHRPVIKQNAESTRLWVVYDASDKSESGYHLNDCLEKRPYLRNQIVEPYG